ncbi:MAG: M48 family metallopeptidase [bacterium]|nr:M48 family metallopeptidase [bacterium]
MWEQIAANKRKSVFLVIGMALLLGVLGYFLGEYFIGPGDGIFGVALATVIWLVMTLVAYFQGDSIYLGIAKAKKIEKGDLPVLFNVVEEMTLASGLAKMPDVYIIDDPAPNAFATGRTPETAAVAVTSGLLKTLNRDELQGVIAHELAHVRNRDIQLMLFAGVLAGAIVLLSEIGLRSMWFGGGRRSRRNDSEGSGGAQAIIMVIAIALMILAPIFAQLIYFAISRKREYLADASAASFTRYPEGLASALEKISKAPAKLASANKATAPMYIINPLARQGKMAANGSSTHPPIDERVKILRSMSGSGFADYDKVYQGMHGGKGVIPDSALSGAGATVGSRQASSDNRSAMAAGFVDEATGVRNDERGRARRVDDYFYKEKGYQRIECQCGATLKIPPEFKSSKVRCPKCGTHYDVTGK